MVACSLNVVAPEAILHGYRAREFLVVKGFGEKLRAVKVVFFMF